MTSYQKTANFFINTIIPEYKKSFGDNWLNALEQSCKRYGPKLISKYGLTEVQSNDLVLFGRRICECFENLANNIEEIKRKHD